MIGIFKTNVENATQVEVLTALLHQYLPAAEISFDIDDCDRILRIKGDVFCSPLVMCLLADNGFNCWVLE